MDQTGVDALLEDSVLCILIWGACREGCRKEQHGEEGIQLEKKKKRHKGLNLGIIKVKIM